jgi:hypothetical protein
MNPSEFDKWIQKNLEQDNYPVSENAWERVSQGLPENKKIKGYWIFRVAAVLVIGLGLFLWLYDQPKKIDSVITETEIKTEKSTENVVSEQSENIIEIATPTIVKTSIKETNFKNKVEKNNDKHESFAQNSNTFLVNNNAEIISNNSESQVVEPSDINLISSNNTVENHHEEVLANVDFPSSKVHIEINAEELLQNAESELESERAEQNQKLRNKVLIQLKNVIKERYTASIDQ